MDASWYNLYATTGMDASWYNLLCLILWWTPHGITSYTLPPCWTPHGIIIADYHCHGRLRHIIVHIKVAHAHVGYMGTLTGQNGEVQGLQGNI